MASVKEWFWCRGCHRAFRAEVWRSEARGRPAGSGSLAFSDIQGALICPFGTCSAMHVTPWTEMCRLYKSRFGMPFPQPPAEGERFEMLTGPRGAEHGSAVRPTDAHVPLVTEEVSSR